MNINELTASVYGSYQTSIDRSSLHTKNAENITGSESFSDVLSQMVGSAADGELSAKEAGELIDSVKDFSDSLVDANEDHDGTKVMDILSDAEKAKEYLSSQSGRSLIAAMTEREISSLITGN